jgi:sigma-B regulation protein RsbU (phosphoserine phosphatase)
MELKRLYTTIERLADQQFESEEALLEFILKEIVRNEEIPIKGGRVWKFDPGTASYELLHQAGDIEKIDEHYRLRIADYPILLELPRQRTILASETDKYLLQHGIVKYSATGVGEKVRWNGHPVYQYLLAVNADYLDENFGYTLGIIGSALTSALKSRTIERRALLLESDLDKAREIQRSILPEHEVHFHHYDIYGVSVPARIVGGDFFDYLHSAEDGDRFSIAIGDAASKGLSAAAQALYVAGALRMGADFQTKISSLMTKANKLMNRTFPEEHFVTLFYGELTKDTKGLLIYSNAGHNSPILLHSDSDAVEYLEPTGRMLGPFPNETYRIESAHLRQGDVLLLYTDGVSEARNARGEFFGEQRLVDLLRKHHARSAKEIAQHILEEVELFAPRDDQSDDQTLVVIRRIT